MKIARNNLIQTLLLGKVKYLSANIYVGSTVEGQYASLQWHWVLPCPVDVSSCEDKQRSEMHKQSGLSFRDTAMQWKWYPNPDEWAREHGTARSLNAGSGEQKCWQASGSHHSGIYTVMWGSVAAFSSLYCSIGFLASLSSIFNSSHLSTRPEKNGFHILVKSEGLKRLCLHSSISGYKMFRIHLQSVLSSLVSQVIFVTYYTNIFICFKFKSLR